MRALGFDDAGADPHVIEHLTSVAVASTTWAATAAAATVGLGLLALARPSLGKLSLGLVGALMVMDLLRFWSPYRENIPTDIPRVELPSESPYHRIDAAAFTDYFYPQTPASGMVASETGGRFLPLDLLNVYLFDEHARELWADRTAWRGVENMRGYQPLQMASYFADFQRLHALDVEPSQVMGSFLFAPVLRDRTMLDAYNGVLVGTISARVGGPQQDSELQALGLEKVLETPEGVTLWRNPNAAGWGWVSASEEWPGLPGRIDGAVVETASRTPDLRRFQVTVPEPGGHLHLSENEYPGWTITAVSASGAEMSGIGRSLALGPGEWTVEHRFRLSPGVRAGLVASLLAALVLAVGSFLPAGGRRTPAETH
jgi:hypothetical protein